MRVFAGMWVEMIMRWCTRDAPAGGVEGLCGEALGGRGWQLWIRVKQGIMYMDRGMSMGSVLEAFKGLRKAK